MDALALPQTGLRKDSPRALRKDAGAAISLFFERGPAKIKALETLAESTFTRACSNQSKWSFRLVSEAQEKIGKMRGRAGDYLKASAAYGKARNFGEGLQSGRRERRLFGMEFYYLGKHEATASVENSIFAKVNLHNTRASMMAFAASVMEQAFGAFKEAGETEMAMKAGKEAASLLFKAGKPGKAVDICVELAAAAKYLCKYRDAEAFYKKAAEYSSDGEAKHSFLQLAGECNSRAIEQSQMDSYTTLAARLSPLS